MAIPINQKKNQERAKNKQQENMVKTNTKDRKEMFNIVINIINVSGFNSLLKGRGSDGIFKIQLYMLCKRFMLEAK